MDKPPTPMRRTRNASLQDLQPGAHLVVPRRGYRHHGIYAGSGRVIHYRGFDRWLRRGRVEEVSLRRFARGRNLLVKTPVAPRFAGLAVVERARARMGEDHYRLWSNNCEHFAEWCVSGSPRSSQVEWWRTRLGRLAARLGLAMTPLAPSAPSRGVASETCTAPMETPR